MWRRTEPDRRMQEDYYLMGSYFTGDESYESFLTDGKSGYASVCVHANIYHERIKTYRI